MHYQFETFQSLQLWLEGQVMPIGNGFKKSQASHERLVYVSQDLTLTVNLATMSAEIGNH